MGIQLLQQEEVKKVYWYSPIATTTCCHQYITGPTQSTTISTPILPSIGQFLPPNFVMHSDSQHT